MPIAVLVLALVLLPGCAEFAHGPRVVPYSADRFYIRHVPLTDPRYQIEQLAGAICAETGRMAELEEAEQFALLDVRDATYRCVPVPTTTG